jgi:hypothetical protein
VLRTDSWQSTDYPELLRYDKDGALAFGMLLLEVNLAAGIGLCSAALNAVAGAAAPGERAPAAASQRSPSAL